MSNFPDLLFDVSSLKERKNELESRGYMLIENALPLDYCEEIVRFIDSYLDNDVAEYESGHMGSMQRIWAAENHSTIVQDYKEKCADILSSIFSKNEKIFPQKILAMRDRAIRFSSKSDKKNFSKGRWHYDSWNDQYKIFLFLRDVGLDNGPFEFIPRTNGKFKKNLLLTRPWWFFNPLTHFTTTKRPYQSISDDRVQSIIDRGFPSLPLVAKQGTMLIVNPSALIHRASPIEAGSRYLSVAYF